MNPERPSPSGGESSERVRVTPSSPSSRPLPPPPPKKAPAGAPKSGPLPQPVPRAPSMADPSLPPRPPSRPAGPKLPAPTAPAGSSFPAPPDGPPAASRAPLARKTKVILASGIVAVVLLAWGALAWQRSLSRPGNGDLRAFLASQLGSSSLVVKGVDQSATPLGDGQTRVAFTADIRTVDTLYTQIPADGYLADQLHVDARGLEKTRGLFADPNAAKIASAAGLAGFPSDPARTSVLKVATAAGASTGLQGVVMARRVSGRWSFSLEEIHPVGLPLAGQPRASFGTSTYVAGVKADDDALRALATSYLAAGDRMAAARTRYEAQLAAERAARVAALLALVKPGTLYRGTAIRQYDQHTWPVFLEITGVNADTAEVKARLRNDGGWSDAREFTGTYASVDGDDTLRLSLGTRSDQMIQGAGPFLGDTGEWTIPFTLDSQGVLKGQTSSFVYRLTRLSGAEAAAVKTELEAPFAAALEASRAGLVYHGAAVSKRSQASEPILLEFVRQENDGALLAAKIETIDGVHRQRSLQGTVETNVYRGGDHLIRLRMSRQDHDPQVSNGSIFGFDWNDLTLMMRPEGNQLVGEDASFTYRLTRATPEYLARLSAAKAEAHRRFASVIRPGAVYDGTVSDRSGFATSLRVRILSMDTSDRTLAVRFESRVQYGVYHEMSGTYDEDSGLIKLGSTGKGVFNPNGVLRVPFFSQNATFQAVLAVGKTAIGGQLQIWSDSWTFNFPVGAVLTPAAAADAAAGANIDPTTGLPAFPSAQGAYILTDAGWKALPMNNAKVTYDALEVTSQTLGGINALLGALNGRQPSQQDQTRPDKLASLTFDGSDPVPVVRGDQVRIVYIGHTVPASAEMLGKYPQLADYPAVEMAPTHTDGEGRRQADLLRIVPGLAGFRQNRMAAMLETPKPDVTLLTCTGTLPPGTYALSVSSDKPEAFELNVR